MNERSHETTSAAGKTPRDSERVGCQDTNRVTAAPATGDRRQGSRPAAGRQRRAEHTPSTTAFTSLLLVVLVLGGLAALVIWRTLNETLEGRANGGHILLACGALAGLVALLWWFKRAMERWQDV